MRIILFVLFCFGNIIFIQSQVSLFDVINTGYQISKTVNSSKNKLDKFWFSTGKL